MSLFLLVDLGSTFTKLTLVDTKKEEIIATSSSFTTVKTNINDGFKKALALMEQSLNKPIQYDKALACSSAAGGLNMVAIGLVPELTAEAAKRVCLGAGAKVSAVYSFALSNDDIKTIETNRPDILLLAGGTDGGNKEFVVNNAKRLAESTVDTPIIYAGNKDAKDEIIEIFKNTNKKLYFSDNVMPSLNKLNVTKTKELIQKLFITHIVKAKGIDQLQILLDAPIIPTPTAVLNAAELLNEGISNDDGFGEIIVVDVGGATTDIYSIAEGNPKQLNTFLTGLEEPFSKRTVEGDLGMRYSSKGILNILNKKELENAIEQFNIIKALEDRTNDVNFIPKTEKEFKTDIFIAGKCVDTAFSRHVGNIKPVYTHMGTNYNQVGKDLTGVDSVIFTGGVLVKNDSTAIISSIISRPDNANELRPIKPTVYTDKFYIIQAMGLLSTVDKDTAFKILKKKLIEVDYEKNTK